jgi:hypothetical protein
MENATKSTLTNVAGQAVHARLIILTSRSRMFIDIQPIARNDDAIGVILIKLVRNDVEQWAIVCVI